MSFSPPSFRIEGCGSLSLRTRRPSLRNYDRHLTFDPPMFPFLLRTRRSRGHPDAKLYRARLSRVICARRALLQVGSLACHASPMIPSCDQPKVTISTMMQCCSEDQLLKGPPTLSISLLCRPGNSLTAVSLVRTEEFESKLNLSGRAATS